MKHHTLFKLDALTGSFEPFARLPAERKMVTPNAVVVDAVRACLYVSDSYIARQPGPGIWRLDIESGEGDLWHEGPFNFANGMVLDPSGRRLYVAESWAYRVVSVQILPDGSPGDTEVVVDNIDAVVDGLTVDADGNIYIACYTPAQILRVGTGGRVDVLICDPEHDIMRYPTNVAFRGDELFASNLGAWHITRIEAGIQGLAVL
jgi:sugar lactone lactonase YvrE